MTERRRIESMLRAHWRQVCEIYQQGLDSENATFETQVPAWEQWDQTHHGFVRLVLVEKNLVLGWAALSPVSRRLVYSGVAEVSVYVAGKFQRQGVGSTLLKALIAAAEENDIWTLQASIFPENVGSLNLHRRCGFRVVGRRERIAKLNNFWRDTLLLERRSELRGND